MALGLPPTLRPVWADDSIGEAVHMMVRGEVIGSLLTAPQARLMRRLHPGKLRTVGTLPGSVHMVWSARPQPTELLTAINAYMARLSRSGELKRLFEKYFVSADHLRDSTHRPEFTLISKRVSRYDRLIARHAEEAGFDWRLIAALIFEESHFVHERTSVAGAYGLMQVTPGAEQDAKVKDYTHPHSNIADGMAQGREAVRYVNAIRKRSRLYSHHVARQLVPVNKRTVTPRQAASATG
jgi:membrane-bound lytic murein transglycosylase F